MRVRAIEDFAEPVLRHRVRLKVEARGLLDAMRELVPALVIRHPSVQQLEFKGQRMVVAVFEALLTEPAAFLPLDTRRTLEASPCGPSA